MTEQDQRTTGRGGRSVRAAVAVLCAFVLAIGLAGPVFAQPGEDLPDEDDATARSSLDLSRYSKWTRPLLGVVVGVDPGHNGGNILDLDAVSERVSDGRGGAGSCDTVGTSTASGYAEHELTFDVAQLLTERLQYLGATVVATRTDNDGVGPCVDVRGRFAEDNDVDVMLSLHAASSTTSAAVQGPGSQAELTPGFFVVVSDPALSPSQAEPTRDLAEAIVEGMTAEGLEPNSDIDEAIAGRDDLATLNFARRPAVRVYLGQMHHHDEAQFMESEDGRVIYAEALAQGVVLWSRGEAR